jgi:2-hydroxy-3-keto-5-methylthiopentenyl-1-phosphate phosphatase
MNNPNIGKMANVALEQAALSEEEQFLKNAMERKQGLESMLENIPTRFKETIEKNKGVKDEFEEFVP